MIVGSWVNKMIHLYVSTYLDCQVILMTKINFSEMTDEDLIL